MLPSRNRVQSKKILANPRSVVLSSEPVLNRPAHTSPQPSAPPTNTAATTSKPKEPPAADPAAQQYTYVTDDSGYTWLYDSVYGQYYYYDAVQGSYVPYSSADSAAASSAAAAATSNAAAADKGAAAHGSADPAKPSKKRRIVRMAGGQVWEDHTLDDWPTDDYRLFAGDLGPDVTSEVLEHAFGKFRSLQRTHVVCDKASGKSRGYGFLSFGDPDDFLAAWKEFNGKYVGSRPIKLRKSSWKDRNADIRKVKRVDKRAFLHYKHKR
ncbi:RNA-binding protein 42 [Coemansia sp. RSA 2708]|nr:RNA-binding protein 42 [Coemansia sp. RSA 2708]